MLFSPQLYFFWIAFRTTTLSGNQFVRLSVSRRPHPLLPSVAAIHLSSLLKTNPSFRPQNTNRFIPQIRHPVRQRSSPLYRVGQLLGSRKRDSVGDGVVADQR